MIEKMKFLSITGPKADIDRVVDTYLSRYEIHLENALSELKTVKDLRPYIETNPYKEKLNIARELAEKIGGQLPEVSETELPTQEEAAKMVDDLNSRLKELNDKKEELKAIKRPGRTIYRIKLQCKGDPGIPVYQVPFWPYFQGIL